MYFFYMNRFVKVEDRKRETYPDVEIKVLVCHGFDVEAYCWYCGDYLADLGDAVSFV